MGERIALIDSQGIVLSCWNTDSNGWAVESGVVAIALAANTNTKPYLCTLLRPAEARQLVDFIERTLAAQEKQATWSASFGTK